ncbi:MAG TPA: SMP-30/gluconolactonase/LRE family protein [Deltaproteobacteria bacterium]|nr:SMP-30/gluconolactonase/LRE family protein [Deltaproteobacteria bacterium]
MKVCRELLILFCLLLGTGCSGFHPIDTLADGDRGPYVDGMHGAENLCFDGAGALFVTGLDGTLYRIEPTTAQRHGRIAARRKIGVMCLGVEAGPDDQVYVGVTDERGERRIARIDKALTKLTTLTGHIPGLNGFAQAHGYLYYTSSNERVICPRGRIYRVRLGEDADFSHPEVVVEKAGMVNGLAFSPDQGTLYYTETLGGLWAYDLAARSRRRIPIPGVLQVFDDLATGPDGTIWLCLNSAQAIVAVREGDVPRAFSIGDLKAPSSCAFGSGPGFREDFLYITEFGLKGRSLTMNGRGVWVVPTAGLKR